MSLLLRVRVGAGRPEILRIELTDGEPVTLLEALKEGEALGLAEDDGESDEYADVDIECNDERVDIPVCDMDVVDEMLGLGLSEEVAVDVDSGDVLEDPLGVGIGAVAEGPLDGAPERDAAFVMIPDAEFSMDCDLTGEADKEDVRLVDCEAEYPDETLRTEDAVVRIETVLADVIVTRADIDISPLRLRVAEAEADNVAVGHDEKPVELEGLPDAVAGIERDSLEVSVVDSHLDTELVAQLVGVATRADTDALFAVPELLVLIKGDLDVLGEMLLLGEIESETVSLDEKLSRKERVDE